MALKRYEWLDDYTSAEVTAQLECRTPVERIGFAESLIEQFGHLPKEVEEVLVSDESVAVRSWVARTTGAQATHFDDDDDDDDDDDRSDPLVRAAVYEYHSVGGDWYDGFNRLPEMARLAWVRSDGFPLVRELFDHTDTRLNIGHHERLALIRAFLSGAAYLLRPPNDRWSRVERGDPLWQLAAKWPREQAQSPEAFRWFKVVQILVFQHIEAWDSTRAELLRKWPDRATRRAIMSGAKPSSDCLKAALGDEDDEIRGEAWSRVHFHSRNWAHALQGYDLVALRALCRNTSLTLAARQEVADRLSALGDLSRASAELQTLIEEKEAQDAAERLPQHMRSLENQLLSVQRDVRRLVRGMWVAAVMAIVLVVVKGCS